MNIVLEFTDSVSLNVANALDANFRLIGAAVFGFKDLLVGYQAGYDTEMKSMTMNDVGLSYSYENMGIHLRGTSIPHECGVSLFYKGETPSYLYLIFEFSYFQKRLKNQVICNSRYRMTKKMHIRTLKKNITD